MFLIFPIKQAESLPAHAPSHLLMDTMGRGLDLITAARIIYHLKHSHKGIKINDSQGLDLNSNNLSFMKDQHILCVSDHSPKQCNAV